MERGRGMSDTAITTITTLLEELQEVDFEVWKDIRFLAANTMVFPEPRDIPLEQHIYQDLIQGCIQRAIAAKNGWNFKQGLRRTDGMYWAIVDSGYPGKRIFADTPAAAILAAYVAAKRASK